MIYPSCDADRAANIDWLNWMCIAAAIVHCDIALAYELRQWLCSLYKITVTLTHKKWLTFFCYFHNFTTKTGCWSLICRCKLWGGTTVSFSAWTSILNRAKQPLHRLHSPVTPVRQFVDRGGLPLEFTCIANLCLCPNCHRTFASHGRNKPINGRRNKGNQKA